MKETTKALIRWYRKQADIHASTDPGKSDDYNTKANALRIKETQKISDGGAVSGEPPTAGSPDLIEKNSGRVLEGLEGLVTRVTDLHLIAPAPPRDWPSPQANVEDHQPVSHLAEFLEPL